MPDGRDTKSNVAVKEAAQLVDVPAVVSLKDFADLIKVPPADIQRKLMSLGVLASLNQKLHPDVVTRLAKNFGFTVNIVTAGAPAAAVAVAAAAGGSAKPAAPAKMRVKGAGGPVARPPVVTIMGHVDHGKTTLLDAIRNAKVVDSEFGGITQHIGAYQVEIDDPLNEGQKRKITFLDTPGHAAFTAMRARGAQVTDIAVIVVAADDGVMPQTAEAISHAKAAGVPIIVAVNKIDKPGANPDRVLTQLTEYDLMPEKYGGTVLSIEVSALQKLGLDDLLEGILLVADAEVEPKADPNARAVGVVVEAQLDKGRGVVATVLVEQGTLRSGDAIVVGASYGRIRAMTNYLGQRVERATPATPVEILGLNNVPSSGDRLEVAKNEKEARQKANLKAVEDRDAKLAATTRVTLEDLVKQYRDGTVKELNVIIKGDVQGSVEAIQDSLTGINHPEVKCTFIAVGVGPIGEADVELAAASNSMIFGFNVRTDNAAAKAAEAGHVQVQEFKIIYDLIDAVKLAMAGLLDPVYEEVPLGTAEVRMPFKLPRSGGIVAGSYIQDGKVTRGASVRIRRGKTLVCEGKVDQLKREKDDVREVAYGYECGILVPGYNPEIGDSIEIFEIKKSLRTI
ncbi:MAG: translation initiation factor IF-2 [Capsulimonadaceae bacterium]|nr:translation initiation factor IF-2 [Capsulimonadaceae bacterium]